MENIRNLRTKNRALVLNWVFSMGASPRAQIAEAVGLSKVAVTNITNELIDQRWLIEEGRTGGVAGRPAGLIDLHPNAGTVVGVDVQPNMVSVMSADLRSKNQSVFTQPPNVSDNVTNTVIAALTRAFRYAQHGPVRNIVVSIPAPVGDNGLPLMPSALPQFHAQWVFDWCKAQNMGPIRMENDVKLAAIAEHQLGAARDATNFALLAERHTGVALGLFLNSKLYRGERGLAGELSLLNWPYQNKLVPLESLPVDGRASALAQIVNALAVALDLSLIVVHQAISSSDQIVGQLQGLMPATVAVSASDFGENGALLGATLEAAKLAQLGLLHTNTQNMPTTLKINPGGQMDKHHG